SLILKGRSARARGTVVATLRGASIYFGASLKSFSDFEETLTMTSNKVLPVALVAALLGGTVGGFVMHSSNNTTTTPDNTQAATQPARTTVIAADKTAPNGQNALLDSEIAAQTRN